MKSLFTEGIERLAQDMNSSQIIALGEASTAVTDINKAATPEARKEARDRHRVWFGVLTDLTKAVKNSGIEQLA